ncbi:MAG: hypothetical protein ACFFAO_16840 [Candidatus Hermodarchaeota archaeon]
MKDSESICCLFYSDEGNLIYDKFSEDLFLSEEKEKQLRMLSYRFLGPLFLTAASSDGGKWIIESIESSLSLFQGRTLNVDILQSFFNLSSSMQTEDGEVTHLSALIGSSHTEDINLFYRKMFEIIHPSILQGKLVAESIQGEDFNFNNFIESELTRGLNLIEYSLGSSRKMYWEEQQKYYCVGVIERIIQDKSKQSNFYSFDKDDIVKKNIIPNIPSFYVMIILPEYYENLINETLKLFDKTSVFSNIRKIKLSSKNKNVLYIEEYIVEEGVKKSYGVILIPHKENVEGTKNIAFYRRNLRLILDAGKDLKDIIFDMNPKFVYEPWSTQTDSNLEKIRQDFG